MTADTTSEVRQGSVLVYMLAAPEDQKYCDLIKKHLKPTIRNLPVPVELLDDFDIPLTEDPAPHKAKLFDAQIVLSLVSVDFIDNDEVYERSKNLLERYNRSENVIVSIIVRNCLWKQTPLADFPVLPTNEQPINNRRHWPDEDEAVYEVVKHLYEQISDIAEIEVITSAPPANGTAQQTTTPTEPPLAQPIAKAPPPTPAPELMEPADTPSGEPPRTEANGAPAPSGADTAPATSATATGQPSAEGEPPPTATAGAAGTGAARFRLTRTRTRKVEVDWRDKYYRSVVWKRGLGYAIDSAIFIYLPLILFGEESDAAVMFVLVFLVGAPFMESRWLGTPGKLILKIQITGLDGERISYWRAFWRNILRSVAFYSYVLIIPLFYQRNRFRTTKKLFHDEWSKTVIGERLAT